MLLLPPPRTEVASTAPCCLPLAFRLLLRSQPTKYIHELPILILDSSSLPFASFLSRCGQGVGGFGPPPPPSRGTVPRDGHCRATAAVTGLLLLSPSRRGVPSRHQALAGHDGAPRLRRGTARPQPRRGANGPRRRPPVWLPSGAPSSLSSLCSAFAHVLQ